MVMLTARLPKKKLLLLAALIVAVIVVLAVCLGGAEKAPAQEGQTQANVSQIKSNADRVAYLSGFGWKVSEEPVQTQEVRIPTEPNEVFTRYNDLQMSQGFDLMQYAGKTVRRYVYEIENYPGDGDGSYYATVLVYQNEIIGGDVAAGEKNGIMHGLQMPK